MLLLVPLIAFLGFFRLFYQEQHEWRRAFLEAAVCWGAALAVVTEGLGILHLLTAVNLAVVWLVITSGCLVYTRSSTHSQQPHLVSASVLRDQMVVVPQAIVRYLLAAICIILLLVGLTAFLAPPNKWDALEYHLPRMVMWSQNHTVNFFPTYEYCELIFSPWAEYTMLHVYVLWGADRFVNFVEWFSFAGCIVGVSVVAEQLGAMGFGQVFAAILFATIPEAILEASGPMNTAVASFWLVATVHFALRWKDNSSWSNTLGLGAAGGLAILSKGTAIAYLPPFAVACWLMSSPVIRREYFVRAAVIALAVLTLNAPQFIRNYRLTGSPLGLPFADAGDDLRWRTDHVSIRGTISNAIRNVSLQLVIPSEHITKTEERLFRDSITAIGSDPDDPATVWPNARFHMNEMSRNEGIAGNPLQFVLIVAAGFFALVSRRRTLVLYAVGLFGAFVLFSALLRWQMWGSRHQLPILALGCPLAGVFLTEVCSTAVLTCISFLLLATSAPFLLDNEIRPLWPWATYSILRTPRQNLYFVDQHPQLAKSYLAATDALKGEGCHDVGLDAFLRFYKYPVMAILNDGEPMHFQYTGVHNETADFYQRNAAKPPCAVLCLGCAGVQEKWSEYRGIGGRASVFGDIVLFSAHGTVPNIETSTTEEKGPKPRALVDQIDADYRALSSLEFGSILASFDQVDKRWPSSRAIGLAEIHGLLDVRWQARELMEHSAPMRRVVEGMGNAHVNYQDLLAASEALHTWRGLLVERIREARQTLSRIETAHQGEIGSTVPSPSGDTQQTAKQPGTTSPRNELESGLVLTHHSYTAGVPNAASAR